MLLDILLILVTFDALISYLVFKFYRDFEEVNPLMNKLIAMTNLEIAMFIKVVSAFFLVWLVRKLLKHPKVKMTEQFIGSIAVTVYVTSYVAGLLFLR